MAMTGEVVMKNPIAEAIQVATATAGEIKIARKVGTWEARVKDIGSITILGNTIGIIMLIPHRSPEKTRYKRLFGRLLFIKIPP
jgi:hypothetical protein